MNHNYNNVNYTMISISSTKGTRDTCLSSKKKEENIVKSNQLICLHNKPF